MKKFRTLFNFCLVLVALGLSAVAHAQMFKVRVGFALVSGAGAAKIKGEVTGIRLRSTLQIRKANLDSEGYATFNIEKGQWIFFLDGAGDESGGILTNANGDVDTQGLIDKDQELVGGLVHNKVRTHYLMFMDEETGLPIPDRGVTLPTITGFKSLNEFIGWQFEFPADAKELSYAGVYDAPGYNPQPYKVSVANDPTPTFDLQIIPMKKVGAYPKGSTQFSIRLGFSEKEGGPAETFNGVVTGWKYNAPYKPISGAMNNGYADLRLDPGLYVFYLDGENQEGGVALFNVERDATAMGTFYREEKLKVEVLFVDVTNGHLVKPSDKDAPTQDGLKVEITQGGFRFEFLPNTEVGSFSSDFKPAGYFPVRYTARNPRSPGVNLLIVPMRSKAATLNVAVKVVDGNSRPIVRASTILLGPKGGKPTSAVALTDADGKSAITVPSDGTYTLVTNSALGGISVKEIVVKGDTSAEVKVESSNSTMIYVLHVDAATGEQVKDVGVAYPAKDGVTLSKLDGMTVLKVKKGARLPRFNVFSQKKGYESIRTTVGVPNQNQVCYNVVIVYLKKS